MGWIWCLQVCTFCRNNFADLGPQPHRLVNCKNIHFLGIDLLCEKISLDIIMKFIRKIWYVSRSFMLIHTEILFINSLLFFLIFFFNCMYLLMEYCNLQDSPSPDHSQGQLVTINENWDSVEDQDQGDEDSDAYESDTDGSESDSDSRLSSRSNSVSRESIKSRSVSRSPSPSNSKSESGSQVMTADLGYLKVPLICYFPVYRMVHIESPPNALVLGHHIRAPLICSPFVHVLPHTDCTSDTPDKMGFMGILIAIVLAAHSHCSTRDTFQY